jgi:hypothetical protein
MYMATWQESTVNRQPLIVNSHKPALKNHKPVLLFVYNDETARGGNTTPFTKHMLMTHNTNMRQCEESTQTCDSARSQHHTSQGSAPTVTDKDEVVPAGNNDEAGHKDEAVRGRRRREQS